MTTVRLLHSSRKYERSSAVYAGDGTSALTALTGSYFDIGGALDLGPNHIFGLGGGDQANPIFRPGTIPLKERPTAAVFLGHNP